MDQLMLNCSPLSLMFHVCFERLVLYYIYVFIIQFPESTAADVFGDDLSISSEDEDDKVVVFCRA